MIRFDLNHLYPKFILQDKNGYAMAKAIEAGLRYFLDRCQEGLDCVLNPDKMPEWRLDEMAWELNSLYDYTAEISAKREWIRSAIPLYSIWGTPKSVVQYLSGYFDAVELEEFWQYGGDPFHFRLTLTGEWTGKNEAWARRAIETAKNVRSVMDALAAGAGAEIRVSGAEDLVLRIPYPMTGTLDAGTWPQESLLGAVAQGGATVDAEGTAYPIPYTMAGTYPDTATIGAVAQGEATVKAEGEAFSVPYTMTGTQPDYQINPLRCLSFTVSPATFTYGEPISCSLKWTLSKTPAALKVYGITQEPSQSGMIYVMTDTPIYASQVFTLEATDELGATVTATATMRAVRNE